MPCPVHRPIVQEYEQLFARCGGKQEPDRRLCRRIGVEGFRYERSEQYRRISHRHYPGWYADHPQFADHAKLVPRDVINKVYNFGGIVTVGTFDSTDDAKRVAKEQHSVPFEEWRVGVFDERLRRP